MSSTAGRAALTPLEQQVRRFMRSVQRAESHAAREEPLLAVKESCQALRDMAALIAPMIEQIQTLTADRNALQARVGALEGLTTDLRRPDLLRRPLPRVEGGPRAAAA
jgi:hypothetical protein